MLCVAVRAHLNQNDLFSYEANHSHVLLTLDSDEALLSHAGIAHDLNVTVIVETFADSEHEVWTGFDSSYPEPLCRAQVTVNAIFNPIEEALGEVTAALRADAPVRNGNSLVLCRHVDNKGHLKCLCRTQFNLVLNHEFSLWASNQFDQFKVAVDKVELVLVTPLVLNILYFFIII